MAVQWEEWEGGERALVKRQQPGSRGSWLRHPLLLLLLPPGPCRCPQRGCYWEGCAGPPPSRQAAPTRPGAGSQAATRLPWPCLPAAAACPHADVRCTKSAATLAAAAGVGARSSSAPAGGQGSQPERRGKGQGGEAFIWRLEQQPGFDCMPGTQLPVADKVSIAAALPQSRAEQSGASSSTCSTSTSNRMHHHATATAQTGAPSFAAAVPPLHCTSVGMPLSRKRGSPRRGWAGVFQAAAADREQRILAPVRNGLCARQTKREAAAEAPPKGPAGSTRATAANTYMNIAGNPHRCQHPHAHLLST